MHLKKLFLIGITVFFIFCSAFNVSAAENNADSVAASTEAYTTSDNSSVDISEIPSVLKSSLSIVSAITSIVLPAIILLIWGKELPKKQIPIFSGILLVIVVIYRVIAIFSPNSDLYGTVYITILFLVGTIGWIYVYNKYIVKPVVEADNPLPKPRIRARKYMEAKIKKCHPAIESIQLYTYTEMKAGSTTEYEIEFADGVKKPHVEINALLGMNLKIDSEALKDAKGIVSLYNDYNNPENNEQLETYKEMLKAAIVKKTQEIKAILSKIDTPDSVNGTDCCLARILLIYCSILASLKKETTFVGFGDNALGLNEKIEQTLFTLKRTGVLGAILLQNYPYGFYYNRNGDKVGRTYCAFVCENETQKYLVLTAFRMRNNEIAPDIGVSRALSKIKEELVKKLDCVKKEAEE